VPPRRVAGQLYFFFTFTVKFNIFNSERVSVFVFDLGGCMQLLNVGTSFQLTLFSFCLIDLLYSFRLRKSAWALPLFYKILVVCFAKFFCLKCTFLDCREFEDL
jgi:hypothetical protein